MGRRLIKPYEVSVWEDQLITPTTGNNYYQEVKIAIIGADTMTAQSRIFSPVLTLNTNGEQTFTFSIKYKYYDIYTNEYIINPIVSLLVNERKIKLKYDNKWYDFIIKQCEESSEEGVFDYTAVDAFVDELSKTGYSLEFNQDLNNNQGTIIELGQQTIKDTDWILDTDDCDLLQQTLEEGIYACTVKGGDLTAYNMTTNRLNTIKKGEIIYIFYTFINNKIGKNFQFLRAIDKESWTYDDHDSIYGTNYRYAGTSTASITDNKITFSKSQTYIDIGSLVTVRHGHRLYYAQQTKYDPVMGRTVDLYQAKIGNSTQDIYHYKDTVYNASSLVTSIVTNGSDFKVIDGSTNITGWRADTLTDVNAKDYSSPILAYAARPAISNVKALLSPEELGTIRNFIQIRFAGVLGKKYENTIFNSGFMDHASTINSIAAGEEYVLRIRYGVHKAKSAEIPKRYGGDRNGVKVIVAYYNTDSDGAKVQGNIARKIDPNGIIFKFNGPFTVRNNKITNGYFDAEKHNYIIDGVVQVPSEKYCYFDPKIKDEKGQMVSHAWDSHDKIFKPTNDTNFLNYYITTAKALRSITQKQLLSSNTRIGIFLYTEDSTLAGTNGRYVFLQEIEIFKSVRDGNNIITLPGSAPATVMAERDNFYVKPNLNTDVSEITIYNSKETIASDLQIEAGDIKSVYNENSEKILAIEESQSNCFNILQTLCETFECWLKITVEHEDNGAVKLDSNHKQIKKIAFKKYIGKDNFAGFKYGINLNTISRSIDSSEFVTKLIVQENASDLVDEGVISIAHADANPSGDAYILNFDYYLKQGLINNPDTFKKDLNNFYNEIKKINKEYQEEQKKYGQLSNALIRAESQRNIIVETFNAYQDSYNEALDNFEQKIGVSYLDYINSNKNNGDIIDSDEIKSAINDIYAASSGLNTYGGLVTSATSEYEKLLLECEGAKEYMITVSTTKPLKNNEVGTLATTKLVIDDYIGGFTFQFQRTDMPTITHSTQVNERTFIDESSVPYTILNITKLPNNYRLQYTDANNVVHTLSNADRMVFSIFDSSNNKPILRQFKLVPTSTFLKNHKGSKRHLNELLEKKKKREKDFHNRYSRFIKEGTWGDNSYINADLYYLDGLQVSRTSAQPQISYSINVTEISEIEGFENYNFEVGDKTYIEDTEFFGWDLIKVGSNLIKTPVKEEVIVSGIEWHLEEPENNIITVQNYKTQFEDLFQRINATVQSVQYNQPNYSRAASILDGNGRINAQILIDSITDLVMNHMGKGG